MSKKASRVGGRIMRALDIPAGAMPRQSLVELQGGSRVRVEGGGEILLYTPQEIRIRLRFGKKLLSVRGSELCCSSYNMGGLGIEGTIDILELLEEE